MTAKCNAAPSRMPKASAAISFQHQWLPCALISPYSLARAAPTAASGLMTEMARHTPQCISLSMSRHESPHFFIPLLLFEF